MITIIIVTGYLQLKTRVMSRVMSCSRYDLMQYCLRLGPLVFWWISINQSINQPIDRTMPDCLETSALCKSVVTLVVNGREMKTRETSTLCS